MSEPRPTAGLPGYEYFVFRSYVPSVPAEIPRLEKTGLDGPFASTHVGQPPSCMAPLPRKMVFASKVNWLASSNYSAVSRRAGDLTSDI